MVFFYIFFNDKFKQQLLQCALSVSFWPRPGRPLASILRHFWAIMRPLGTVLGRLCAILGPFGTILGHLEAILGHLEAMLGRVGAILGPFWGHFGAILGPSWGLLGLSWGHPAVILQSSRADSALWAQARDFQAQRLKQCLKRRSAEHGRSPLNKTTEISV